MDVRCNIFIKGVFSKINCQLPCQFTKIDSTFISNEGISLIVSINSSKSDYSCCNAPMSRVFSSSSLASLKSKTWQWILAYFNSEEYFDDTANRHTEIIDKIGSLSVVSAERFSCSCHAFSHGIECICLKVAKKSTPAFNFCSKPSDIVCKDREENPADFLAEDMIHLKLEEIYSFVNSAMTGTNFKFPVT